MQEEALVRDILRPLLHLAEAQLEQSITHRLPCPSHRLLIHLKKVRLPRWSERHKQHPTAIQQMATMTRMV